MSVEDRLPYSPLWPLGRRVESLGFRLEVDGDIVVTKFLGRTVGRYNFPSKEIHPTIFKQCENLVIEDLVFYRKLARFQR